MDKKTKEIGIYIHIPFCKSKCYYCDFNSYSDKMELVEAYFSALKKEIILYANEAKDYKVKTIFIGGGTPSCVEHRHISEVMSLIRQNYNMRDIKEVSIESNPGTLTQDKLYSYLENGIERLSIGLQTWDNELLKKIGRIHNIGDFEESFCIARKAGFKNINVDLIFGIPGQDISHWKNTLENVVMLDPEHISCYGLKIEEDTVFYKMMMDKKIEYIDDVVDREMYTWTNEYLQNKNIFQYEISNYAKVGYECKHNIIYWKAQEYLGFGAGAHSYFNGMRYGNAGKLDDYIKPLEQNELPICDQTLIDENESMKEFMMLGLRMTKGIENKEFSSRYSKDMFDVFGTNIKKLTNKELIHVSGDNIRLTDRGLDFANEVFMEFV